MQNADVLTSEPEIIRETLPRDKHEIQNQENLYCEEFLSFITHPATTNQFNLFEFTSTNNLEINHKY